MDFSILRPRVLSVIKRFSRGKEWQCINFGILRPKQLSVIKKVSVL